MALVKSKVISVSGKDTAETRLTQADAGVLQAGAELKTAEAALALRQEQLKQSVLKAPIGGTVLRVHAWPGERVGNEGVVDLADLAEMDVVAEVYETDIAKIYPGQKAEVRLPGSSDTYQAQVREIGYQVRKNDVRDTDPLADRDTRVVEVRLTLLDSGIEALQHQIYRQVQVQIQP
ncbi:MAG: efflux RND transporter periplasmic adaptor subunit [Pseudomonadota bacterium]|nr:efflux RND transporter periplasmic adaptor subunit [Pseudomonadota bacterium]